MAKAARTATANEDDQRAEAADHVSARDYLRSLESGVSSAVGLRV